MSYQRCNKVVTCACGVQGACNQPAGHAEEAGCLTDARCLCWRIVSLHDARRGIWMRRLDPDTLELCAGREGDDEDVIIRRTDLPEKFDKLVSVLLVGPFARETNDLSDIDPQPWRARKRRPDGTVQ